MAGQTFHWRRALVVGLVLGALALLTSVAPVHDAVMAIVGRVSPLVGVHPVGGPIVFVALAAISSLFMFVSSVPLVPVGVDAWGAVNTTLLIWAGWFVGGILAYLIGRSLGEQVVRRLLSRGQWGRYAHVASHDMAFWRVLAVQLAVPSDIAGYFFGIAGVRFRVFLLALAIAEIPYAIGTVYLGTAFLERNAAVLGALGLGLLAAVVLARRRPKPEEAPDIP